MCHSGFFNRTVTVAACLNITCMILTTCFTTAICCCQKLQESTCDTAAQTPLINPQSDLHCFWSFILYPLSGVGIPVLLWSCVVSISWVRMSLWTYISNLWASEPEFTLGLFTHLCANMTVWHATPHNAEWKRWRNSSLKHKKTPSWPPDVILVALPFSFIDQGRALTTRSKMLCNEAET